ncbi:MAG TPA: DUF4190 domain-containing protein [Phycisphaerales bacterium]|nr:DUF4190 domain-containing protein [Phycisphaerales bacterium]
MSAHPTPPQFQMPVQDDRGPVSGLAITALVLSLVPGVGLLGVIFGIAALLTMNNSSPARSGKGLAIAGIVVGFVTSALGVLLCAGILLPALGKARESARELKSRSQLALMTQSLLAYAQDNRDHLPEIATGWEQRLSATGLSPGAFESPRKDADWTGPSYIYVPPATSVDRVPNPSQTVILYEDPRLSRSPMVPVAFLDGSVREIPEAELERLLERQGRTEPGR